MRIPITSILLMLLATLAVKADEPRSCNSFKSANGQFEAHLGTDYRWQVFEKRSKKAIYNFSDQIGNRIWFSSMTLKLSNDGKYIVAVDDFSEQNPNSNPEILFFLENGQRIKSYHLGEVIDPKFITYSVSHFSWCWLWPKASEIEDAAIEIKTNELAVLTFDVVSGKLISKNDDERLQNGSIFVYGQVFKEGKGSYRVKVICPIRGDIKPGNTIPFLAQKLEWIRDGEYGGWILRDGKLVSGPLMLIPNNCSSDQ